MNLLRSAKVLLRWLATVLRRLGIGGSRAPEDSQQRRIAVTVTITEPGQHPVRFSSVGGAATAKATLLRRCAPLHIEVPSPDEPDNKGSGGHKSAPGAMGALLHGPPGCGKTLLARALAGELNLPLLAVTGSELGELSGEGAAARLRELFADAVRRAPCVVFIDNLEAISKKAADDSGAGAKTEEGGPVVEQLIRSLDSLAPQPPRVVVLAASNRLEEIDPALLRPGRFGRPIALNLPEPRERAEIIALLAREHPELADLDALALAARTQGCSGADLRRLVLRITEFVRGRGLRDSLGGSAIDPADLERALAER